MSWGLWISLGFNVAQALTLFVVLHRCLGGVKRKQSRNAILQQKLTAEEATTKTLRTQVKNLEAENARLTDLAKWAGK
jgi:cytochrome c-type biogenesis protein CcmH/NrfG